MSAQHLRHLENRGCHATLIAVLLDTEATITDQILDMHNWLLDKELDQLVARKERIEVELSGRLRDPFPPRGRDGLLRPDEHLF